MNTLAFLALLGSVVNGAPTDSCRTIPSDICKAEGEAYHKYQNGLREFCLREENVYKMVCTMRLSDDGQCALMLDVVKCLHAEMERCGVKSNFYQFGLRAIFHLTSIDNVPLDGGLSAQDVTPRCERVILINQTLKPALRDSTDMRQWLVSFPDN